MNTFVNVTYVNTMVILMVQVQFQRKCLSKEQMLRVIGKIKGKSKEFNACNCSKKCWLHQKFKNSGKSDFARLQNGEIRFA